MPISNEIILNLFNLCNSTNLHIILSTIWVLSKLFCETCEKNIIPVKNLLQIFTKIMLATPIIKLQENIISAIGYLFENCDNTDIFNEFLPDLFKLFCELINKVPENSLKYLSTAIQNIINKQTPEILEKYKEFLLQIINSIFIKIGLLMNSKNIENPPDENILNVIETIYETIELPNEINIKVFEFCKNFIINYSKLYSVLFFSYK